MLVSYPPDDKKKHYKPIYIINVSRPKATCPAGFTCQPDDKYIGERLVVHEASIPWPAPPETVTKAEAGLSVPAAFMAMIFAGGFGFFMV